MLVVDFSFLFLVVRVTSQTDTYQIVSWVHGTLQCVMDVFVFKFDWEYVHYTLSEIGDGVVGYYTNYDHYHEISVVVDYCI